MAQVLKNEWVKKFVPEHLLDKFWDRLEQWNGSRIFGYTYEEDVLATILHGLQVDYAEENEFPGMKKVSKEVYYNLLSKYKKILTFRPSEANPRIEYVSLKTGRMIAVKKDLDFKGKKIKTPRTNPNINYFITKEPI